MELCSTHPLVANRIDLLHRSGLPGAPTEWTTPSVGTVPMVRAAVQAAAAAAPWAALLALLVSWLVWDSAAAVAWSVTALGVALFVRWRVRYPSGHEPVAPVTALLDRLDASPVAGVPVEVRGRVTGRADPGFVIGPDLVISDDGGFLPLLYTNPLPFGRDWFGARKAGRLVGADVVARGWYFRAPDPSVEVRSLRVLEPPEQRRLPATVRAWGWISSLAFSGVVFAIGLALLAAQAG